MTYCYFFKLQYFFYAIFNKDKESIKIFNLKKNYVEKMGKNENLKKIQKLAEIVIHFKVNIQCIRLIELI